jgi:hypothetical protein
VITPSRRTPDQTQIALFWLEASPVGWNRIARRVSAAARLDRWENARLFALLNLAMADGYIGSFEAKYRYKFWRPVTAIREANADGNDATTGDPSWTPLATTPPMPDHDSAHSVEGAAAAAVLEQFFERSNFAFQTCSTSLPAGSRCSDASPVYRSYTGFTQAAVENGLSRIYVGYHFRRAVTEGMEHGSNIGRWAFRHYLRPREDDRELSIEKQGEAFPQNAECLLDDSNLPGLRKADPPDQCDIPVVAAKRFQPRFGPQPNHAIGAIVERLVHPTKRILLPSPG